MKVEMGRNTIRIGALDTDPLRSIGLRALLGNEPDFELNFLRADEARSLADNDVVLLGGPNEANILETMNHLKLIRPAVRVIITGCADDDEAIFRAIAAGAKGYVSETMPSEDFAEAIRAVNQGLVWAPRRIFTMMIDRSSIFLRRGCVPAQMTGREKQVLEMLVAGCSNKEIAAPLGIEERTVKSHVAKLMRKVGVENRVKLSVHAITHSLVTAG